MRIKKNTDCHHTIGNQQRSDPVLLNSLPADDEQLQLMCESLQSTMQRLKTMGHRLRIAAHDIQAAAKNVQAATEGMYLGEHAREDRAGFPESG